MRLDALRGRNGQKVRPVYILAKTQGYFPRQLGGRFSRNAPIPS